MTCALAAGRVRGQDAARAPALDLAGELAAGGVALSAQEAVRSSIHASAELRALRATRREAGARSDEAIIALIPRLEVSAQHSWLSDVHSDGLPVPPAAVADAAARRAAGLDDPAASRADSYEFPEFPTRTRARAELTFGLSDLLWVVLPTLRSARQLEIAERWSVAAGQQAVALGALEAYYAYARARAHFVVARASAEEAKQHAQTAALHVEVGVLDPAGELAARARAGAAELQLTRAAAARDDALEGLASVMQRRLALDAGVGADAIEPPPPAAAPQPELLARALQRRVELKMLRAAVEASDAAGDASDALSWPRLDLVAGIEVQDPKPRTFPNEEGYGTAWDISAIARWSPNDLARGRAHAAGANAATMRARARLEAFERAVRAEVARAYVALEAAGRAAEQSRENLAPAEASYAASEARFRAGTAPSREVIEAGAELRRARLDYVDAAIDARLALARLRFAVGDELQEPSALARASGLKTRGTTDGDRQE